VPAGFRETARIWGSSVLDGLSALRSPRVLVQIVGWTAITWMTSAGILYLILEAFSLDVPVTAAPFLLVALTFGFFVPSSPASIGVYDAIAIKTLENVFSVPQEEATSFALVAHVIFLVPPTVLGATFFLLHHLSVRRIQEWGREPASIPVAATSSGSPEAPPPT
jgi:glycosyltransferase 2 family protein